MPRRVENLLNRVEHDDLLLNLRLTDTEQFDKKLDSVVNRIAFALVVSASIVGSALLIQSGRAFTLPFFGYELPIDQLSFWAAILLGARLLWSIIRAKGM
jgi:hypothetical protein